MPTTVPSHVKPLNQASDLPQQEMRDTDNDNILATEQYVIDPSGQAIVQRNDESQNRLQAFVGTRLGRILLTRLLGQGSAGRVFEGFHSGLGITVAVKVLNASMVHPEMLRALQTEAHLMAQLNHPNVVRVLDFDNESAIPHMTMELVHGSSLGDIIQQSGWLRPASAIGLIAQATIGLAAAQRLGITHQDIKPDNLLISRGGLLKIADLGLAACSNQLTALPLELQSGGTVAYMAPERFSDPQASDFRSDMYSLGVTLYQCLTGRVPFEGKKYHEVMIGHLTKPIPDPRLFNRQVCEPIVTIIHKMMHKEPSRRYASYGVLYDALASYIRTIPDHTQISTWTAIHKSVWNTGHHYN